VVTVSFVEPALAVMVTEVELLACQLKVTLWPEPIDVGFAENVRVGTVDVFELVAQEEEPHMARRSVPHEIQRRYCFVMKVVSCPRLTRGAKSDARLRSAVVGRMNRRVENWAWRAEKGRRVGRKLYAMR
jgi:hypothetical protein